LVWIAKIPQGDRCIGSAGYPGILPIEKGKEVVLLGIIEGDSLFEMFSGWDKLSQEIQGRPQGMVCAYQESTVLYALGQG
jgi:hypothetical protein